MEVGVSMIGMLAAGVGACTKGETVGDTVEEDTLAANSNPGSDIA